MAALKFNHQRWVPVASLAFLAVIIASAVISELFQGPHDTSEIWEQEKTLFSPQEITSINKIILKNRMGHFSFLKDDGPHGDWNLEYPRHLPANQASIETIIKAMQEIKIRRTYPKDAINITNFALNAPVMEIILEGPDQKIEIKVGLVNPIDNTTYIMLSGDQEIYHISTFAYPLDTADLTFFIDPNIFPHNLNQISSIKIYRGNSKNNDLFFVLNKNGTAWFDRQQKEIPLDKVESYWQRFADMRSIAILDKMTEKLEKAIQRYFSAIQYTVVLTDLEGLETTYTVGQASSYQLPDVKIERQQIFLIKASNREHPYVFAQSDMEIFRQKVTP